MLYRDTSLLGILKLNDYIRYAPNFAESYHHWKRFVKVKTLVAHNMRFDKKCLLICLDEFLDVKDNFKTYCTMKIWKGEFKDAKLVTCCKKLRIQLDRHHNALDDAKACADLFLRAIKDGR
jgi:DNA polymerase-3 subunit epsilon